MPHVLDASAMLALVKNEPGAERMVEALTSDELCFAHLINLCEVFYTTAREDSEDDAEAVIWFLTEITGVVPYADNDPEFYWEAGRLRALATSQRLSLSLADCFALASARRLGADLLTCDHREFDPLVHWALCPLTFIR